MRSVDTDDAVFLRRDGLTAPDCGVCGDFMRHTRLVLGPDKAVNVHSGFVVFTRRGWERGVGVLVGEDSRCPNAAARRRAEVRYSPPCIDCSRKAERPAAAVVGSGFLNGGVLWIGLLGVPILQLFTLLPT
jgi:hypothetical protein